jgi:succinyl-diaminopimelate desuccinylase
MKDKILSFIDESAAIAVELETELTKRPAISPESGGEGELDKCVFLESWLRARGISQLERYDAPDPRAKGGVRPSLVATSGGAATIPGGAGSARLWIMSHLDVVPPGEASLWKSDPWTVIQADGGDGRGVRLIGRGVEDNQQGLTSSVLAALSLVSQGIIPQHTVKLLFVADEENGSQYGINWLLKNVPDLFRADDMVLIPDSGAPTGETIEIAEKTLLWVRFSTIGAQAHGSRPDQGINAHLAGAALALRLHEGLSGAFPDRDPLFEPDYSTFQPTRKEANVPNINTIPGDDVFYMDMRVLPRYPAKTVLAEIDRIKGEVEAKYGVKISYTLPQCHESKATSPDAPLVRLHYGLTQKISDHDPLFEPDYSTFQPTKKEANVPNINTIPGEDVFCMDMRILPRYPVKTVLVEIDRIKAEVEARYKVTIAYTMPQRMESKPTSADAPLIKLLSKSIVEVYGVKTRPIGIGGGTVGAYLRNEGIDSAVWCRIDDTAHQPNEYAIIGNILGDAKVMSLLMTN